MAAVNVYSLDRKHVWRWLLSAVTALGVILLLPTSQGFAQNQSIESKGISLSPAVVQLEIKAGQVDVPFSVKVTNNNQQTAALQISSLDFRSLNETGGLAFLGTDANELGHKYGLASWLVIPTPSVTVAAGETKTIPFSIDNRSDLSPGGHYAALLFKSSVTTATSSPNNVSVNQVVSSLVFVRKTDGAIYNLQLTGVVLDRSIVRLPKTISTTFYNNGNIQTAPRGYAVLTDPLSHEVGRAILNVESSLVLPETSRQITSPFTNVKRSWLPGRYTATLHYRADGNQQFTTVKLRFWYINPWPIAALTLLVTGLIVIGKKLKVVKNTKRLFTGLKRRKSNK